MAPPAAPNKEAIESNERIISALRFGKDWMEEVVAYLEILK